MSDVDQTDPDDLKAQWQRVADAVKDRRLTLGWTQQEAADRAGVSLATWRLVESAGRERFQELTLRGLVRGLGWPVGSIERLRAGGPPPTPDELTEPAPNPNDPAAAGATRRRAFDYLVPEQSLPAGFARKYLDLTPEEQGMVQGFMEGLFARRGS
ncbi:MAG TPA: helix-turn-helix transcriptional regulator [Acidimicrobiales bacterium]|nr:helix-turn-helix transcriptional regulator [Acidimicrobiales bacterium]